MILFPNAKINIGLNIVRKREDGFHELQTLFYPTKLSDVLEFVENGEECDSYSFSGIEIDGKSEDNLIAKAVNLLRENHIIPFLDVHLHKVIPFGAGLGGGSADGSFMLKGLNDYFNLGISQSDLIDYSAQLGSDCPFFIHNTPCLATGRGEILEPIPFVLKNKTLVLVKPPFGVSTPQAFSNIVPCVPEVNLQDAINEPIGKWGLHVKNDFEHSVLPQFPEIESIKDMLTTLGANYVSMSGSGSTVFALFEGDVNELQKEFPSDYFIWQETVNS